MGTHRYIAKRRFTLVSGGISGDWKKAEFRKTPMETPFFPLAFRGHMMRTKRHMMGEGSWEILKRRSSARDWLIGATMLFWEPGLETIQLKSSQSSVVSFPKRRICGDINKLYATVWVSGSEDTGFPPFIAVCMQRPHPGLDFP